MIKKLNGPSLLFAACFFVACTSENNKTREMALAMCNCFSKLNDSIPAQAKAVFIKLASEDKVKDRYTEEMNKLDPAELEKLNRALMTVAEKGSPAQRCMEEMDKEYKTVGGSEGEINRKMGDALKGKAGCEMVAVLMRMQAEKLGQ